MRSIKGKIILVDDERYEKALLELSLLKKEYDVKVDYFSSAEEALKELKRTNENIFLLISDMHMHKMDGLTFKKKIDQDKELQKKAIPFIFFSSTATQAEVEEAYEYRIQGYFRKPLTLEEQARQISIIIDYWITARHPYTNDFQW